MSKQVGKSHDQQAMQLIAIRHGETAWNVSARLQGQTDIELNEKGLQQARMLAQVLANEKFDAIYSSDLSRAYLTAQEVANIHHIQVKQIQGLRERHFGHYQGKTFAEIQALSPDDAQRWKTRDPDFVPGISGESLHMLQTRVINTLNEIAVKHMGQTVVVVTHGGVLDALYRYASNLDMRAARTWQIDNTSVSRMTWGQQSAHIRSWADTSHLQASRELQAVKSTLADL